MDKEYSRVIVLGAGASRSYKESPTGLRPPLAREILNTYYKLDISSNRYVLIGHIINYVRDTRHIDPIDFSTWDEDLEIVLSEIDETIRTLAAQKKKRRLNREEFYMFTLAVNTYNQLIFLFTTIFNEIQNGPISIPYALLANELTSRDTVITFNWDTLMDRALLSTHKWSPHNGYCIMPESIFDDGWKTPDAFEPAMGGPGYIKLHGSTNWLAPYHGVNLTTGEKFTFSRYGMDKLFVFLAATQPYETYEDRYWGPYEQFSYCYYPPNLPLLEDSTPKGRVKVRMVSAIDLPEHGKVVIGDNIVYSMPLIIPPVRNKQYGRYGKIFSRLWSRSEVEISKCEELYIIGYSFPGTDMASRNLFNKAMRANSVLQRVVIINPDPERVQALLRNEFGVSKSKIVSRTEYFDVPLTGSARIL